MAHDLFLSHASEDKSVADAVCAGLESAGIRCWIAPRDIVPGASWGEAIVNAISDSRVMVVMFSSHSNSSQQVLREVERAVAKSVIIVPFRVQSVIPSGAMEYFLGAQHWLDALTPPLERHIEVLVDVIRRLLRPDDTGRVGSARQDERQLPSLSAVRRAPVSAEGWYRRGEQSREAHQYEDAVQRYDNALALDARHFFAWFNKARALQALGELEPAIDCYKRAAEINAEESACYSNIASCLNLLARHQEALNFVDSALRRNPGSSHAFTEKAHALGSLGRHQEAGEACDRALEIDPAFEMAWNNKGASLGFQGRYAEAVECCRKALQINPGNELAKAGVARWSGFLFANKARNT